MQVNVISKTKQEFNGTVYYLCGKYFQHKGKRLHRAVWEYSNGKIPEGFDIHHEDGDRSNNQIENLRLLPRSEHHAEHQDQCSENGKKAVVYAIAAAPAWHRSEAGKAWHREHEREYWGKREPTEYVCTMCGRTFTSLRVYGKTENRFCGPNCRAKYRRRRLSNENTQRCSCGN